MPLGWIDFSAKDRSKVLNVLDLLSESGTLDELGIAPVRDGFADLFFPGTSTIQTRAKYFLMVPYILKDMELGHETNPNRMLRVIDEIERNCAKQLMGQRDIEGIIGRRALSQNRWVKRTPADIYWAGIRNYGIFTGGRLSLSEYVKAICALKSQKETLARLGNRADNAEDNDADDKDAGGISAMRFWRIPTYQETWKETLKMALTPDEGSFLKSQIVHLYPDSMLGYIFRENRKEILECRRFQALCSIIHTFPEQVQHDFNLAADFSDFIYVIRTIYNIIISEGKNENANREWETMKPDQPEIAAVNLEAIFDRLGIQRNVFLCTFLMRCREMMNRGDLDGMILEIKRRERDLKQSRAKTLHTGEFNPDDWYGGGELDYRFSNARVLIKDIFESEGSLC